MRFGILVGAGCAGVLSLAFAQTEPERQESDPLAAVVEELFEGGIRIDLERGRCAIDAQVLAGYQPLEYLLVGERGQTHESLLGTAVQASLLNTALLLLGAEPGQNARWVELKGDAAADGVDNDGLSGPPAEEQPDPDARPVPKRFAIEPPEGDGFYLYAAWREGDESYLYRVEDLVANVDEARAMRRHRFVFLGSKMIRPRADADEEIFAADLEQNLINVAYFRAGHTLLTTATASAVSEDVWFANHWLVPGEGQSLRLIFSRTRIPAFQATSNAESAPHAAGDQPEPVFQGLPQVTRESER